MIQKIKRDLRALADPKKAAFFPRFFKTGKGEYGEGDRFLGVTVPKIRVIAKKYTTASFADIQKLLCDPFHEARLLGLVILTEQFRKADTTEQNKIVSFYKKNLAGVNNWDLVDLSAPQILGVHCVRTENDAMLRRCAQSKDLWKKRIGIVATLAFIRENKLNQTFEIATILLHHEHDLIHKAVGWMLREAGKRDPARLKRFLKKHHRTMPRTMLRYAIEKFDASTRLKYLQIH